MRNTCIRVIIRVLELITRVSSQHPLQDVGAFLGDSFNVLGRPGRRAVTLLEPFQNISRLKRLPKTRTRRPHLPASPQTLLRDRLEHRVNLTALGDWRR